MSVVQCGTHKLGIKIEKIYNLQARKFYTSHAQNLAEQLWMEAGAYYQSAPDGGERECQWYISQMCDKQWF